MQREELGEVLPVEDCNYCHAFLFVIYEYSDSIFGSSVVFRSS